MRTYDPFRELDLLRREVERFFDARNPARYLRGSFLPGRAAQSYPLINLAEDNDNVTVEALAPGVDPESLEVTAVRNQITLSGEKKASVENGAEATWHRNERAAGRFTRTLTLPTEVEGDHVKAEYKDGVLRLTLPKAEAAKPRKIAVSVA